MVLEEIGGSGMRKSSQWDFSSEMLCWIMVDTFRVSKKIISRNARQRILNKSINGMKILRRLIVSWTTEWPRKVASKQSTNAVSKKTFSSMPFMQHYWQEINKWHAVWECPDSIRVFPWQRNATGGEEKRSFSFQKGMYIESVVADINFRYTKWGDWAWCTKVCKSQWPFLICIHTLVYEREQIKAN